MIPGREPGGGGRQVGAAGDKGKLFATGLQPAAEELAPEVAQAARWLESRFGNSRMTGSGSAVFATAREGTGSVAPPLATFPADELPPAWVGRLCRGLDEHPLRGWAAD